MSQNSSPSSSCLIVGNYTHDVLIKNDVILTSSLGGASSFISNVLDGLSIPCSVVSKVGHDFSYFPSHKPIKLNPPFQTTLFHAHFHDSSVHTNHDRTLKLIHTCQSITPKDLPVFNYKFGLAVGVAGEITPNTLSKMLDICQTVFVDVQSLIRVFDKKTGEVTLVKLRDSGFYHLLDRIGFLKASEDEAPFVDVEDVRNKCCVVVTNGKEGCTVYCGGEEHRIKPFRAVQVDCTGAGDSFLGGFVAGLVNGLAVHDAAALGNFFGSLTVAQLGLPTFDPRLLQAVKDEVLKKRSQLFACHDRQKGKLMFQKPRDHEEFLAVLCATKTQQCKSDLPKPRAAESCSSNMGATAPPRGTLEVENKYQ